MADGERANIRPVSYSGKYKELLRADRGTDHTFETRWGELGPIGVVYLLITHPRKPRCICTASNGHITVLWAVQDTMKLGSLRLLNVGYLGRARIDE
jgi:hypothetical protein